MLSLCDQSCIGQLPACAITNLSEGTCMLTAMQQVLPPQQNFVPERGTLQQISLGF